MNKYDFVPMNLEPEQYVGRGNFTMTPLLTSHTDSYMPKHIQDILNNARANSGGYGDRLDLTVLPDDVFAIYQNRGNGVSPNKKGVFSLSNLNQLLKDDYNYTAYRLLQAKNRAVENENAVNSILGQVQGYSPNNITERILMSVMAGE